MQEATGEYVLFLDADDFFDGEMLEKMVARAEADHSDVVACGNYVFDDQQKKVVGINLINKELLKRSYWKPKELADNLFIVCTPAPWNKLIRREIILKNNLQFDKRAHAADDLMFHCLVLACASKISLIEEALVCYRVNTPGQQSSNKKNAVADVLQTLTRAYEILKILNVWDTYKNAFFNQIKCSLQFELGDCKKEQRKKELLSIRKNLPDELYNPIFDSSFPAVSVIIPAYNEENYLCECIESAQHQTLQNIEIICVDDGSTDNTLKILNQYAQKDTRIKVIHQKNSGQAIARNSAMKLATGQFIQFLDADDYLEPATCECLYLYSKVYELDMLFFMAIDFENKTKKKVDMPYHCLVWLPESFISVFSWQNLKDILHSVAVTACLTFYRRAFLTENKINWIKKKLAYEDSPFFIESILKAQRVGALKEPFYHRRLHGTNTTQNMDKNFPDFIKVSYLTAKIAQKYAGDVGGNVVVGGYIGTTYKNYLNLSREAQHKFIRNLLDFYTVLKNEYQLDFPKDIEKWYQEHKALSSSSPYAFFEDVLA